MVQIKGLVVEDLLYALEEAGIPKSDLGARIGKTRQYVSRILDEDSLVNSGALRAGAKHSTGFRPVQVSDAVASECACGVSDHGRNRLIQLLAARSAHSPQLDRVKAFGFDI
jgi:hypothetical protein